MTLIWKSAIFYLPFTFFFGHQGKDTSGVARAFPGGRVTHPEGQNEEENK